MSSGGTEFTPEFIAAERLRMRPRARDDGWTDPDTGEWVSMPSTVRPLVKSELYLAALDEIEELQGVLNATGMAGDRGF